MRAIDSGEWHEVTEADYRAFLRAHPLRARLRKKLDDHPTYPGAFIYDAEDFAASKRHHKDERDHKVAYWIRHEGRQRFWIPTLAVPEDQRRFKS